MSHAIKVSDVHLSQLAVLETARIMKLPVKENADVVFYDGTKAHGTAVKLPGWSREIVVCDDSSIVYDNYYGDWGSIDRLVEFEARVMAYTEGYDPARVSMVEHQPGIIEYITEEV